MKLSNSEVQSVNTCREGWWAKYMRRRNKVQIGQNKPAKRGTKRKAQGNDEDREA